MHHFLGYSLDEWMAIATILSIAGGVLIWLLNVAIKNGTSQLSKSVQKLINQIDSLSHTMHSIESRSNRTADRLDTLEDKFEQHIGEAKVRNTRITNLEKEVFNNNRGGNNGNH